MTFKYKGIDFVSLIGVLISIYGAYQSTADKWLFVGWAAAGLVWIGHIIDSVLSYKTHMRREDHLSELESTITELNETINQLNSDLYIQRRNAESQLFMINMLMSRSDASSTFTKATPQAERGNNHYGKQGI
ncbi:hypothetical protein ROV42_02150 [Pasteurella multocida]|uniref:hypothetical protein n=2 Tax=Pasteurella multocida TaxID=747 RepID=UPI000D384C89|nr:hypothetical protein [Pasteurella multocida]AWB55759.1 hypothetical protein pm9n_09265 [Pasteurella multocida]MDH3003473.1 hypothetical protein [Pasteurella multocida]MEB3483818.1 hypothetical protein [Pasteurella multocida]MEB3495738.1 hypothetical protein [Pasteurella multocida]MEE3714896.1 hypothetical protein [Pasteurella multocida]